MPEANQYSTSTVQALRWPSGKKRSMGGPFDILYQPKANPKASTAPAKRGPKSKQAHHPRTLASLHDPAPSTFCTAISKTHDREKSQRIAKAGI